MSFGENVRRHRRDKNLTQGELSDLCSIKTGHISKIENDKADPSLSTIYKLMRALECSPNALLLDSDEMGLNGTMAVALERMEKLDERSKRILIDLIDNYCAAKFMRDNFQGEGLFDRFLVSAGKSTPMLADNKEI